MFIHLQSFTFFKPFSFRYFLQSAHVCVIPFLHFSVLSTLSLCPRYRRAFHIYLWTFFVHNLLNTCYRIRICNFLYLGKVCEGSSIFFLAIYFGTLKSSLGYLSLAPFLCALGCFGIYALVRELGKDPGYRKWDRKLFMRSFEEVRKEG